MAVLPDEFYLNGNVVQVARDLIGKVLYTRWNGELTAGMIVETEAYSHRDDKACHAHLQRRTRRTKIMFAAGGVAYVYLCYGMHHLFNVVTNREGLADAVLVRALEPLEGAGIMAIRRDVPAGDRRLTSGPGNLTRALGISVADYGRRLDDEHMGIEDAGIAVDSTRIMVSSRIGVEYAAEDALKPWRFYLKENRWVSKL
jgi:DNA-3-methyladenine glycosylase